MNHKIRTLAIRVNRFFWRSLTQSTIANIDSHLSWWSLADEFLGKVFSDVCEWRAKVFKTNISTRVCYEGVSIVYIRPRDKEKEMNDPKGKRVEIRCKKEKKKKREKDWATRVSHRAYPRDKWFYARLKTRHRPWFSFLHLSIFLSFVPFSSSRLSTPSTILKFLSRRILEWSALYLMTMKMAFKHTCHIW